jgi:hypothetical protein
MIETKTSTVTILQETEGHFEEEAETLQLEV